MSLSRFALALLAASILSSGAMAADPPRCAVWTAISGKCVNWDRFTSPPGSDKLAAAKSAAAKPAAKPAAKKPAAAAKEAAPAKDEVLTADLLLQRAGAALTKGDTDNALLLGQAAIVVAPTDPKPYVALGDLYIRANRAEFARGFYDMALELDPQDSAAKAAIAKLETMPQAKQPANGG